MCGSLEIRDAVAQMLGLIAAVSLLVGGIGVMNVMLMTVRERTREIGIRMATGARQRDIMRQFLTESVLVTLVGGSVGVVSGLLFGALLILWDVPLVFSLSAMLLAFACAVGTGLVFGYLPARAAARLDPVVALPRAMTGLSMTRYFLSTLCGALPLSGCSYTAGDQRS